MGNDSSILSSCSAFLHSTAQSSETPTMKLKKNYFLYQIILPDSAAFKTYKISSSKSWLWNAIHLLSAMWLQVTSIKQATKPWRNSRALPKRIPVTDKKWEVFLTICQSQPGYFSLPKAQSCMIVEKKNPLQPNQFANPGLPQQVRTPGMVSNSHIRLYSSHSWRSFWASKNEVMDQYSTFVFQLKDFFFSPFLYNNNNNLKICVELAYQTEGSPDI